MKKLVAPFLIAAAAVLCAATTAYAQTQDALRLEQVMTSTELTAAGLDKLTPTERAALEQWLERYTLVVARVARTGDAAERAPAAVAAGSGSRMPVRAVPSNPGFPDAPGSAAIPRRISPPTGISPNTGRVVEESAGGDVYVHYDDAMPRDYTIVSNIEGGTFVALGNGTMWEIYLPDAPKVAGWRVGTELVVRRASTAQNVGQSVFDYILINGAPGHMAHARYRGRVATKTNTQ